MITYRPSPHFRQALNDLDDYIVVKWVEYSETLEIWSRLPDKVPVMEHKYHRNNKARIKAGIKPMYNWDMEWIILKQLNIYIL